MSNDQPSLPGVEFRGNESRWEAVFYLGCGAAIIWLIATSYDGWRALLACSVFGAVFLILAYHKAFGDLDRSVHLAFDEAGLAVPHAFRRPIPWHAISRYDFEENEERSNLRVWIDTPRLYDPLTDEPLETWGATWWGARISLHPITADVGAIEAAFRRFAPHLHRG